MDGFGWEVRISAGGRSCHSERNDAFPDGGISDSAATWSGFVLALQDLVGGIELYDLRGVTSAMSPHGRAGPPEGPT